MLVGGSTRIPLVEERLRDEFLREPSRAVDPDLAVALGAALQAAMIVGRSVGPVLVDVTGHTMGIEACEGITFMGLELIFSPIVHRNTPLPARYERAYSTMFDDQESVVIHVLQGERPEIHRNRSIGKFRPSLESGGGERSKVVVRFDLTLDGTLKVTATQPATGRARELTIDNALSQFRADERDRAEARLGAMFDASEELIDDEDLPSPKQWRTNDSDSGTLSTDGFQSAQSEFQEAVALLKQAETLRPSVEGQDAMDLESLCKNLEDAMAADDPVAVAGLSAELDDLLFYVR